MYKRIDEFIKVAEAKRHEAPAVWYALYTELREIYALTDPQAVEYLEAKWNKLRADHELSAWDEKFTEATIDTEGYAKRNYGTTETLLDAAQQRAIDAMKLQEQMQRLANNYGQGTGINTVTNIGTTTGTGFFTGLFK